MTNEIRTQCYGCAYITSVPGSAHKRCMFDFTAAGVKMPKGDPHGIKNGWYIFPINYDPVWMIEKCEGRAEEKDPDLVKASDPITDILSILGRRGL